MTVRLENGWVAVRFGERLGDGALSQASDLVEHRVDRVDVEVAIASRAEDGADLQDLEQIELDVAHVSDVVPHRFCSSYLTPGELVRSVSEAGMGTQP